MTSGVPEVAEAVSFLGPCLSDSRMLYMANSGQLAGGAWRSPSLPPWHAGQATEERGGALKFLRPLSWRGTVPGQEHRSLGPLALGETEQCCVCLGV